MAADRNLTQAHGDGFGYLPPQPRFLEDGVGTLPAVQQGRRVNREGEGMLLERH